MLRYERDYIMRMIAAAAAAVARLRERLSGGHAPDEVAQEARAAQTALLGQEAALLRALDPASAAHAIGDRERLMAWADLLLVEAEGQRRAGDEKGAEVVERKALSLKVLAAPEPPA
jgi:hypothetical protein